MQQYLIKIAWKNDAFEATVSDSFPSRDYYAISTNNFQEIIDMGYAYVEHEFCGYEDFGLEIPDWYKNGEYEFVCQFQDVASMLKAFSAYAPLAAISRETGINQTLLSHYVNGLKIPRRKQQERILEGLHRIGALLKNSMIG